MRRLSSLPRLCDIIGAWIILNIGWKTSIYFWVNFSTKTHENEIAARPLKKLNKQKKGKVVKHQAISCIWIGKH
jgi:hypothetical protein